MSSYELYYNCCKIAIAEKGHEMEERRMNERMILALAILSTALEEDFLPLGPTFIAFQARGVSYDDFMLLLSQLEASQYIILTTETLRLTLKGRTLAEKVNRTITEKETSNA